MKKLLTTTALIAFLTIFSTSCSSDDDSVNPVLEINTANLLDQEPFLYNDFKLTTIIDRGLSNNTDATLTTIIKQDWNGAILSFLNSNSGALDVDNNNLPFTYTLDSNGINLFFANETLRLQNPELLNNGVLTFNLSFRTESNDGEEVSYLGQFTYN